MGRLLEWPANSRVPWVDVKESIGPASSLDVATEALIKSEQVLDKDFSMEVGAACLSWMSRRPGEGVVRVTVQRCRARA
jgi:hypothetical protein